MKVIGHFRTPVPCRPSAVRLCHSNSKSGSLRSAFSGWSGIKKYLKSYSIADVGRHKSLTLINLLSRLYSVKELCSVPGVYRSLFFYRKKCRTSVNRERRSLRTGIKELHRACRSSAGVRSLVTLMCHEGKGVGRYKAGRLMK